jgi:hypothetical protein
MDVAQALQEAQVTTSEAKFTARSPIPFATPRQEELPALPIEKRKSGSDKYSGQVMPPLAEEGSTRQGVNPKLVLQMEVEINSDVRGQEQTYPDSLLPVQQNTSCIEIRE